MPGAGPEVSAAGRAAMPTVVLRTPGKSIRPPDRAGYILHMNSTDELLAPGGRLAARLPGWESRPQQMEMAALLAAAIRDRRHAIVEAGTGTGKSLAYLVPAVLAATADQEEDGADSAADADGDHPESGGAAARRGPRRVVISTHTIALQEQLVSKDIPLVAAVMPREFSAVLVKGRGNYVSLRRLALARERAGSLFGEDREEEQLAAIAAWAERTADGSLADLPFVPLDGVWDEVASDAGNCMGRACPTHQRCHYFAARRRMARAQVLIVNHALFFSDLALKRAGAGFLPPYDVVIFDEAHMVEAAASDHLGGGLSSAAVDRALAKLFNERTHRGLIVHYGLDALEPAVLRCRRAAEDFFATLRAARPVRGPSPELYQMSFARRPTRGAQLPPTIEAVLTSSSSRRNATCPEMRNGSSRDFSEYFSTIAAFTRSRSTRPILQPQKRRSVISS